MLLLALAGFAFIRDTALTLCFVVSFLTSLYFVFRFVVVKPVLAIVVFLGALVTGSKNILLPSPCVPVCM
jgi:hypothetical protein